MMIVNEKQATINLDLVYRKDTNFQSDLNPLHQMSSSSTNKKRDQLSKLNLKIQQEHLSVQFERFTQHVALVRHSHNSRHRDPKAFKELEDGAASIISELIRQPRIIVDVLSYLRKDPVSSTSIIAGIVINRIVHPFFNDSSATTALLFEMLAWQAEECQSTMHNSSSTSTDLKQFFARALFIDDPSFLEEWDPLEQPLPVLPNCSSETLLTTLLKSFALRMDITWFFRELWNPVLPSVVAFLGVLPSSHQTGFQTTQLEDGEVFKSAMKAVNRLLLHTFNEKSMMNWPPTATAIGPSSIKHSPY